MASLGEIIRESQIWKSIFRHPMPVDRRNRVVVMLTNFFLHLHPVSIKKQGIALSYTWCMGGVTFFLFLVETVTGVLLMFYYRPTLEWAYTDILALRDVASLGILREIHRWGAHAELAGGLREHVGEHESRQPEREQAAGDRQGREAQCHRRTQGDLQEPAAVFRLLPLLRRLDRLRGHGGDGPWRSGPLFGRLRLARLRRRSRRRIGLTDRSGLRPGAGSCEDARGIPLHSGLRATDGSGRLRGRRLGRRRLGRGSRLRGRSGGGRLACLLLRAGHGEDVGHARTSTPCGRLRGRSGLRRGRLLGGGGGGLLRSRFGGLISRGRRRSGSLAVGSPGGRQNLRHRHLLLVCHGSMASARRHPCHRDGHPLAERGTA
ncbi:MAG: hypothetical protein ACKON8_14020 [Planctomycetota bacterium]